MKMGGVSLKGAHHKINQDSFTACEVTGGYVLAISDGVGSRRRSQAGSAALCTAAREIADAHACNISDENIFLAEIHAAWKKILTEHHLKIDECNATALIAVKGSENIWTFRLGDGFIGVAADDEVFALFDAKEEDFVNVTVCLGEDFQPELWERRHSSCRNFKGIVAATDGVTLQMDEKTLRNFTADFCKAYCATEQQEILAEIKSWLPDFAGSDDKTLAFLMQEAVTFGH